MADGLTGELVPGDKVIYASSSGQEFMTTFKGINADGTIQLECKSHAKRDRVLRKVQEQGGTAQEVPRGALAYGSSGLSGVGQHSPPDRSQRRLRRGQWKGGPEQEAVDPAADARGSPGPPGPEQGHGLAFGRVWAGEQGQSPALDSGGAAPPMASAGTKQEATDSEGLGSPGGLRTITRTPTFGAQAGPAFGGTGDEPTQPEPGGGVTVELTPSMYACQVADWLSEMEAQAGKSDVSIPRFLTSLFPPRQGAQAGSHPPFPLG